jgi:hypothetical protein
VTRTRRRQVYALAGVRTTEAGYTEAVRVRFTPAELALLADAHQKCCPRAVFGAFVAALCVVAVGE